MNQTNKKPQLCVAKKQETMDTQHCKKSEKVVTQTKL